MCPDASPTHEALHVHHVLIILHLRPTQGAGVGGRVDGWMGKRVGKRMVRREQIG